MNITKSVLERNRGNIENKEKEIMKAGGVVGYNRLITLYPSVCKNIYNIDGNNVLLTSRCCLINYSIRNSTNKDAKLYNKTTYICDLNFPGNITPSMLAADDISKILMEAQIVPLYAFNNSHVEFLNGKFIDYGLTMVDLSCPYDYGVVNFSGTTKEDQYDPFYKELIDPGFFNPKYYSPVLKELTNGNSSKSGILDEFIDERTRITKDINNYQRNIKLFKNGIERKDRVINKRTMNTNELLLDIFSDLIFMPIEDLVMVVDVSGKLSLNIQKLTTFTRFNISANSFYYNKVAESIEKTINQFRNKINGESFYLTIMKNEVLLELNIAFKNKDNSVDEIRITNPIHKLYSQFALNNESIVNSIENNAEYAKLNFLESAYRNPDTKLISSAIKMVKDYSNILDNYKASLALTHYESNEMLENLQTKLLEVNNKNE